MYVFKRKEKKERKDKTVIIKREVGERNIHCGTGAMSVRLLFSSIEELGENNFIIFD